MNTPLTLCHSIGQIMIGLIQLVTHANVTVDQILVGSIEKGILALIGLEKTDNPLHAQRILDKMLKYRIFPDEAGKMNLNLKDVNGGLLLVPQFTLVAETQKGTRPGFSKGMPPEEGRILFQYLTDHAKKMYARTETGRFGANMQINLCNDGPTTFILSA